MTMTVPSDGPPLSASLSLSLSLCVLVQEESSVYGVLLDYEGAFREASPHILDASHLRPSEGAGSTPI